MRIPQLKFLCEVVDAGFSVSKAAESLETSQPSVSRHIQSLESELGVQIFARNKGRLVGLTKPGLDIVRVARRMLLDANTLQQIGADFATASSGSLTITTSHLHARYVLPAVIQRFRSEYPEVRIVLRQGNPTQIAEWVSDGGADLSICSAPIKPISDLVLVPCYDHPKVLLTPRGHPLAKRDKPTLEDLARYPLITYDPEFSVHAQVMQAFRRKDLMPNIVLSATDVDVMKTYVKCGLGVAIVAALAYDAAEDHALCAIDATHLFAANKIYVGARRNTYLRAYAYDFIRMFSPKLTRTRMEAAIFE